MSKTERVLSASTKRAAEKIGHTGETLDKALVRLIKIHNICVKFHGRPLDKEGIEALEKKLQKRKSIDQPELDDEILKTMAGGVGVGARPTELAKALSKTRSTINLRVETLEEKGVITGYVPEVDYEKLGYGMVGFMGIICPDEVTDKLLRVLKEDDSVFDIWGITTGTFNLFAKCRFRNHREIKDLRRRILRVNGVKDVEICLLGDEE